MDELVRRYIQSKTHVAHAQDYFRLRKHILTHIEYALAMTMAHCIVVIESGWRRNRQTYRPIKSFKSDRPMACLPWRLPCVGLFSFLEYCNNIRTHRKEHLKNVHI